MKRPWYDWAMVKWVLDESADNRVTVTVAARLLLLARLSNNEDLSQSPKVVAVIHSLSSYNPAPDLLLFFTTGDSLDDEICVVDATSIATTAFVLPCVQEQGDEFPSNLEEATYFVVFPPRSQWMEIWSEDDVGD